jgi:alkaline phosphatase D
MAICISLPSRRRLLMTAAAATAVSTVGGIVRPYLSRAADRPVITHGVQSGDVSVDSGVVLPGPILANYLE